MVAFPGRAFSAVPPSPWSGALSFSGVDAGVQFDDGLVGFGVGKAGVAFTDPTTEKIGLAGVTATLSPSVPGRWLFIGDTQQYSADAVATMEPYGIGVFGNNVPPGTYEVTLARPGGLHCALDPEKGGFAWPVAGRENTFRLAVHSGLFTVFIVQCETGG
jgi:hypothetical protein